MKYLEPWRLLRLAVHKLHIKGKHNTYGRPSPPKIQGCQIDQQKQSWSKDQLQDRIANKGMAWPNYRRFSFSS